MFSPRKSIKVLAISAGLLAAIGGTAFAQTTGLVQASATRGLYWVDAFSVKHYVPDMQTARYFFGNSPIREISPTDMLAYPKGQPLQLGMSPAMFDRNRDPLAVAEHIPVVNVRYERVTETNGKRTSIQERTTVGSTSLQTQDAPEAVVHTADGEAEEEPSPRQGQLVRDRDSSDVFFIDRYGIRHAVTGTDRQTFFGGTRARRMSSDELASMPIGHSISDRTPPQYFDTVRRANLERDEP